MMCEVTYRKHDKYGWDRMDPALRTIIRKDWMDALCPYPLVEVDAARKLATLRNPNKCPNEGHILALIIEAREGKAAPREFMTNNERSLMEQRQASEKREVYDSNAIIAEIGKRKKVN